jgi:hypothetical protein
VTTFLIINLVSNHHTTSSYVITFLSHKPNFKWPCHVTYANTLLSSKPSYKWPCHVSWMLIGISCTSRWLPFWLGAMQCFLWLRFLCDLSKAIRHYSSCMWHLWLKINHKTNRKYGNSLYMTLAILYHEYSLWVQTKASWQPMYIKISNWNYTISYFPCKHLCLLMQ